MKIDISEKRDNLKKLSAAFESCPENEAIKEIIEKEVNELTEITKTSTKLEANQYAISK